MGEEQRCEAVDLFRDAVDELLNVRLDLMSSAELIELLVAVEAERRRLDALDKRLRAVGAAGGRGRPAEDGSG